MDSKLLILLLIVTLVFVVIFQIAKASEYVSILKGEEQTRKQNNKINAFMFLVFMIVGLIGAYWCNDLFFKKTLFVQGSASVQGETIDTMLYITLAITGAVFIGTQITLFWFAYKYQEKDGVKAYFFPHDNRLELIWTVIPAIVLTGLVTYGIITWFKMTDDAPKNAVVVEVTGHQFGWEYRYPGPDGILGRKNYKLTTSNNSLGVDFEGDKNSHDDIRFNALHIPVDTPVKLVINAQDVIHDVGLSHFRMKMDAVPGIPTTMWFTPKYTTEEMKVITGNPNFAYEISCDQMCGKGHYSMKGIIVVQTREEYKKWLSEQEPEYWTYNKSAKPKADSATAAPATATTSQSSASATTAVNAKASEPTAMLTKK